MELYAPTRKDREQWIMIFKLIIEMNEANISTRDISPLVYKRRKEEENKNAESNGKT